MNEVDFQELRIAVLQWAEAKGILSASNPLAQWKKTMEEATEIGEAIALNDEDKLHDAYGDTLVTLIIGCELAGTDPVSCLTKAYGVISKRSGKMVDGIFVKDEQPA